MGMVDPMNAQDMLDLALGRLEGSSRAEVERQLAADPHQAETFDRLVRAQNRLAQRAGQRHRDRSNCEFVDVQCLATYTRAPARALEPPLEVRLGLRPLLAARVRLRPEER